MNNLINLQKVSSFSDDTIKKVYNWIYSLPIEEQEKLKGLSNNEVVKEYNNKNILSVEKESVDKWWDNLKDEDQDNFGCISYEEVYLAYCKIHNIKINYDNLHNYEKEQSNIQEENVWDEAIKKSGFMSEYVDRLYLLNWLKEHYTLIKK